MRKFFFFLACVSLLATSCYKKSTEDKNSKDNNSATAANTDSAQKTSKDQSMFPGFDAAEELKALQGSWKVKDDAFSKELATWKIDGNKVTITRGDKTKQGQLEIKYPGELAFVEKSNGGEKRTYFAFAHFGSDVYIGLGTAGVKRGDAYMLAKDGVVVFKDGACKHYKKKIFGGFDDPTEIKCELKDEAGKKSLFYSIPDSFKKGEFRNFSVQVLGQILVDDQMKSSKAQKVQ